MFFFLSTQVFSKITVEVLYKVNDKIITNIDLENEKKFLMFLNPDLKNLSKTQINTISLNSLKNRKIKEIELIKYFDFEKENLGKRYLENFTANSSYKNLDNLKIQLKNFNLSFNYFETNFIIDNLWREFVYSKFKSMIKIDIDKLKKQIKKNISGIEELNLSEILFEIKSDTNLDELSKSIYLEIEKSGFEAAATIYSISDTKKFGGKLGWVRSNQISDIIYNEIKKGKKLTNPIKTRNGYIILKINEIRNVTEEINLDEELDKLVLIETEKELNKLGYIYFNKIKKRTFINEN